MKKIGFSFLVVQAAIASFASTLVCREKGYELSTDGNADWFAESSGVDGTVFRSGQVGDDGLSWLEITVVGPARFSFKWKVSSELGYDKLYYHVLGTDLIGDISGEKDWSSVCLWIPKGQHRIHWTYEKDYSASGGRDAGWVTAIDIDRGWKTVDNSDGTVTLAGAYAKPAGDVVLPSEINGKTVTAIGDDAFYDCIAMTSVQIPSTVKTIGSGAFCACELLATITLPEGLVEIGESAFSACYSLKSVSIPSSVKSVGSYAFGSCDGLTAVTPLCEPDCIGPQAFRGCTGLKDKDGNIIVAGVLFECKSDVPNLTLPIGITRISAYCIDSWNSVVETLTIPDGVKTIDEKAFSGCSKLKAVNIPLSVDEIGEGAFQGCTGLRDANGFVVVGNVLFGYVGTASDVVIPEGVTAISKSVFENQTSLTSVRIPTSVKTIGKRAFYGCSNLANAEIPSSVESIGEYAFYDCRTAANLSIPPKVKEIGDYTFYNCDGLASIVIPSGVATIGESSFNSCGSLANVTIPESVESIGEYSFAYCSGLKTVTIENDDLKMGDCAFYRCDGLADGNGFVVVGDTLYAYKGTETHVAVPRGVARIAYGAFYNRSDLVSIKFPDGLKEIGNSAFYGCSKLEAATIPETVTRIGNLAFGNCGKLSALTLQDGLLEIGDSAFSSCYSLKAVSVPSSVKSMGAQAFWNCTGLKDSDGFIIVNNVLYQYVDAHMWDSPSSITIPSTVTEISDMAFWACTSLTDVTIPSSVMKIGDMAFGDCDYIKSIVIPSSVKSISDNAFKNCEGLESITIPEGVMSIGKCAFAGCKSLKTITIPGSVSEVGEWFDDIWSSSKSAIQTVTLSEGISSIAMNAFYEVCPELRTINLPSSLIAIGDQAFIHCKLTSVSLPAGLKKLGRFAFGYCPLTEVVLPSGVRVIEDNLFTECTVLKTVVIPEGVAEIGSDAFSNCTSLQSLELPWGVEIIGRSAFANCRSLSAVTIPSSVTSIGSGAFWCYYNPLRTVSVYLGDVERVRTMLEGSGLTTTSLKFEEINNPNINITTAALPVGKVGVPYSAQLAAEGGAAPCSWVLRETLHPTMGSYWESREVNAFAVEGTARGWRGDDSCWELALPFEFSFYGRGYSKVYVSSNGTLDFGSSYSSCSASENALIQRTMIAPLWADLKTSGGDVYVSASSDAVTIRWAGAYYSGGDAVNFSATLYRNGAIRLSYGVGNEKGGLIGISAGDGKTRMICSCSQSGSMSNADDIVFSTGAFPPHNGLPEGLALNSTGEISGLPTDRSLGCFAVGAIDAGGTGSKKDMQIYVYDDSAALPDGCYLEVVDDVVWTFTISDGEASIGGLAGSLAVDMSIAGEIVVPDKLGGCLVTKIGSGAFRGCDKMTSITLPEGVVSVGTGAFAGCNGLKRAILFNQNVAASVFPSGCEVVYAVDNQVEFDLGDYGQRVGGGELIQMVRYGEDAEEPIVAADEGWRFAGWSRSMCGITESVKIVALYQAVKYKIDYTGDSGLPNVNATEYTIEDEISFVSLQDKDTARFVRWDPAKIEKGSTGDKKVVACWETKTVADLLKGCSNVALSGTADWFAKWTGSEWILQSGTIGDRQKSILTCKVEGSGTLSFKWKVSSECEEGCQDDYLNFVADGEEVAWIGGEKGWIEKSIALAESDSAHTLSWSYIKDKVGVAGDDCGWLKDVVWTPSAAEPIPELGPSADASAVQAALEGSADAKLAASITDAATYNAYREWALKIGASDVKASPFAWASFATDSAALLAKMPTDEDLKVEEFKPSAMAGSFDFTVSVKDVTIGDKASVDNLKKFFGLEGAESLAPAAFSSENVSLDFKEPQDGKLKFAATPAVDNAKSFFMKVKVK